MFDETEVRVGDERVPTRLYRSDDHSGVVLVLAPGSGASHTHPSTVALAEGLASAGVHVKTFDFLYRARGRNAPDRMPKLVEAFRAVLEDTEERVGEVAFVGGKSMGGRVALEVAKTRASLHGVLLFSYPLSPPGRDAERAPREALLRASTVPVRIVQGSRDAFGGEAVMKEIVASLAPRVSLEVLAGGDHGLEIGKIARAGRTAEEVWRGLGASAGAWVRSRADAHTSGARFE